MAYFYIIYFSGAPVRYCYYCSARIVYTISTCPKNLLNKRKYTYHQDSGKNIAHRKHHAPCVRYRRGHHFRVKGQVPYQAFSVPQDLYQKDPDDDAAATPSGGAQSRVFLMETNNNEDILSNNIHSSDIHSNSIIASSIHGNSNHNNSITDVYSKLPNVPNELCENSDDYVCPFHAPHVLGDDPQYREILKQYNTRVRTKLM